MFRKRVRREYTLRLCIPAPHTSCPGSLRNRDRLERRMYAPNPDSDRSIHRFNDQQQIDHFPTTTILRFHAIFYSLFDSLPLLNRN